MRQGTDRDMSNAAVVALSTGKISRRQLLTMTAAGVSAAALPGWDASALALQDAGQRGGSLHGAVALPATSMDPYTARAASGDFIVWRALYNNLIELGQTGDPIPELATEWTISDDGLTYTFSLQPGVTFHDGTVLDAAAIQASLDRFRAEGSTFSGAEKLRVISEIDSSDPGTLVITLSAVNAPFLATLATCPVVSPTAVEEMGEDLTLHGVGSGPFKFESWEPNATAVFSRNENYWELAPDGEPYPLLDEFVLDGVPDDSVRLLNLRSGQFQIIDRINPRDLASVSGDPNIQTVETPHATPHIVAMNPNRAPFDNLLLRQAVSHALDRQAIIDNLSFGTGYTTTLPFPRDAWFFVDDPAPVYDADRAKELLAEAGFSDGIDVKLTHINRTVDTQLAQIVKAQLEAVGFRVEIESLERTTWVDLWKAGDGELGLLQGSAQPTDPDVEAGIFLAGSFINWTEYTNPDVQELLAAANAVTGREERLAIWKEIAGHVVEDAVYIYIGNTPTVAGIRSNVHDVQFVSGLIWELTHASMS
ncbi:MAG: ABC transporter substrate-binding protein [Thermomicrobiales bacterium]|nr:ABC transporter substrate-binding protein [Thermomicrobiales bacterium]